MPENNILGILSDLIGAIQHFGERINVQRQLMMILLIIFLAWFLTSMFWFLIGRRVLGWADGRLQGRKGALARYTMYVVKNILFPVLVLFALTYTKQAFVSRGWHVGLLSGSIFLFWVVLAYRLLLGLLYGRLDKQAARRYHYRFLAPLMGILVLGWMLNHLIPIRRFGIGGDMEWLLEPCYVGGCIHRHSRFFTSGLMVPALRKILPVLPSNPSQKCTPAPWKPD